MPVDLGPPGLKAIRIVVVAANDLAKPPASDFSLPDPFAVIFVDSKQTHTTSVIKETLHPCWNEHFVVMVKRSSVVTVRILDKCKIKRRDQAFLGFVEMRVTDYLDLEVGGQVPVLLDLKGTNDNPAVQGKVKLHLSTNRTMSATSSRSTDFPFALPSLALNDCSRSINNESVNNESIYNASIYNESLCNASVYNESIYNASIYNESAYSASITGNTPSVSGFYSPSISLSPTLSSHTISPEVTPTMAMLNLEQQQPLPNIPTRPVSSGGTSMAESPGPPIPSAPGIVSPGQPITNAQHNLNANEDHSAPLPEGWESGIDPLGLTYYVDLHSGSITRNCPSPNRPSSSEQRPKMDISQQIAQSAPPDNKSFYPDTPGASEPSPVHKQSPYAPPFPSSVPDASAAGAVDESALKQFIDAAKNLGLDQDVLTGLLVARSNATGSRLTTQSSEHSSTILGHTRYGKSNRDTPPSRLAPAFVPTTDEADAMRRMYEGVLLFSPVTGRPRNLAYLNAQTLEEIHLTAPPPPTRYSRWRAM